jgi:hypothetical protein
VIQAKPSDILAHIVSQRTESRAAGVYAPC